jgi:type I restriction enzyme S subunit
MSENWITQLPERWKLKQIRHIFRIHNGATPTSGDSEYWNGDINWITPEDLGNNTGKGIAESRRKITTEGYANSGVSLAPAGSIAISTRAPIGHLAITTIPSCVNQGCRLLEPKEGNPDFWYYATVAAKPILVSRGQGTTFMELPRQGLASVKLPVPPVQEQQAIARFLDFKTAQIDFLIAKKQTLLEKLAEKRTALITRAVTKGLDHSAQMKDSGVEWLGEIPKCWKQTRVKFIGDLILGLTYSPNDVVGDNGTLVLRSSNVQDGKIDLNDCVYVSCDIPKKLVTKAGDLLICSRNGSRALIGKCALISEEASGQTFGAFMTVLRTKHSRFLYYILNSAIFKFQSGRFLTSTINQLTTETLGGFEIALPPDETEEAIIQYLDKATGTIDNQASKAQSVIDRLKEYRAALITNAVTGKIDVRDFSIPLPAEGQAI